jgi:hypothetical protein
VPKKQGNRKQKRKNKSRRRFREIYVVVREFIVVWGEPVEGRIYFSYDKGEGIYVWLVHFSDFLDETGC